MTSLWFVVPAHGRVDVTRVCLGQLARTCAELRDHGVDATAVVIANDENRETAEALGFGTIRRSNHPLGRRWNDGFQLAGEAGADYVVPFGSDDWIDTVLLRAQLPEHGEIRCSTMSAIVSEDRTRLARLTIPYDGGDGIRIYPTSMLQPLGYRPIEEDRDRAMDTSLLRGVSRALGRPPRFRYFDVHPFQIVDWKTAENLNSYAACLKYLQGVELDPFTALADLYPAAALAEMAALQREAVAA